MTRAIRVDLCYRTRRAARAAPLMLQEFQLGDGNVQYLALFAQLTDYFFEIHSAVLPLGVL